MGLGLQGLVRTGGLGFGLVCVCKVTDLGILLFRVVGFGFRLGCKIGARIVILRMIVIGLWGI